MIEQYLKKRALRKWLKRFIDTRGGNLLFQNHGLCSNIPVGTRTLFKRLFIQWDGYSGNYNYPICDNLADDIGLRNTPNMQYTGLPHYKGRQLELRIRLAKFVYFKLL